MDRPMQQELKHESLAEPASEETQDKPSQVSEDKLGHRSGSKDSGTLSKAAAARML